MGDDLTEALDAFLARHETELIAFRRDLHAHPELGYAERRTTQVVFDRLTAAGLRPVLLPETTGLWADIGPGEPRVALRADLDALPLDDEKKVPYRSVFPGACHACGHDVHTTMVVGAGLFLAEQAAAGRFRGGAPLKRRPGPVPPTQDPGRGARPAPPFQRLAGYPCRPPVLHLYEEVGRRMPTTFLRIFPRSSAAFPRPSFRS